MNTFKNHNTCKVKVTHTPAETKGRSARPAGPALLLGLTLILGLVPVQALAGTLPYESWLTTLQQSFTGPVAFSVSLIGIISCGATLIFMGAEIGHFVRSIIYLVMVMTLLVGSNSLMTQLFNGTAALNGSPVPDAVLRDTPPTRWQPEQQGQVYADGPDAAAARARSRQAA